MTADLQQAADSRFAAALADTGGRDPRDYYRDRLAELKHSNPAGYAELVTYYEDTLIPSIVEQGVDPIAAWLAFGVRLAEATAPGRAVAVDRVGRSSPYSPPGERMDMFLHLPEDRRTRALLVGLPPEPSGPQMATYEWLVLGRRGASSPRNRP